MESQGFGEEVPHYAVEDKIQTEEHLQNMDRRQ